MLSCSLPVAVCPVWLCVSLLVFRSMRGLDILLCIKVMEQTTEPKQLTPAERHYEALKKAQRDYWRRKHPNPKPRGRPRKVVPEEVAPPEVVRLGLSD